jgi:hypothetical protein
VVELGPLGPVDPATGRHPNTPAAELFNYWAHGPGSKDIRKPAAERCYLYRQEQATLVDLLAGGRKKSRRRTYVARVREASRTGHGSPKRVDIPQLPSSMKVPIAVFVLAVTVILAVALPFPFNFPAVAFWNLFLAWRMIHNIERKRFAQQLRRLPEDLPPLLSDEELDARVFTLANPDEDRSFEDPAPIPLPKSLRDRSWQRWEERRSTTAVRSLGYSFLDHPERYGNVRLSTEMSLLAKRTRLRLTTSREMNKAIKAAYGVNQQTKEQIAALDAEFDDLALQFGCALSGIEHPQMLAAPPQLDRPFTTKTDCADGHVGEHPIIATFVDSLGRQRVTRACRWCLSEWSDLV